ncbi:unnamed protein product [Acanthoscelides obtectus]|uniref:Gustatory receptor n=1 Tax=Acanthoscelides obtectus TaxID=200917 RepID=A0A9P0P8E6_ACAOB|nr:unnamed protein product [Acanthoscelides obtectus]CAK1630673.1 hypothetical protein AOBTE_LOCUS6481 [Acanthoscelides obtectus]
MKDLIQTMRVILLEYSTRVTEVRTLQQIRIFLLKLDHYRPLSANRVYEIDLKVAVSIFANILTYVLVALQFEVSEG